MNTSKDLHEELDELRKFKAEAEQMRSLKSKVSAYFMRIWFGPKLTKSIENWLKNKQSTSTTVNLLSAIVRRVIKVNIIIFAVALVPSGLLFWQNIIMKAQNNSLITQIEEQRAASSSQQVAEYLRLLFSSDKKQAIAAESLLVSDTLNKNISIERLATLVNSGQNEVRCLALNALNRILENDNSSPKMTLRDAIAPSHPTSYDVKGNPLSGTNVYINGLHCNAANFTGVSIGNISFYEANLPNAKFFASDLTGVRFTNSTLSHSDFSGAILCIRNQNCVSFVTTNLTHSKITLVPAYQGAINSAMDLKLSLIHI